MFPATSDIKPECEVKLRLGNVVLKEDKSFTKFIASGCRSKVTTVISDKSLISEGVRVKEEVSV